MDWWQPLIGVVAGTVLGSILTYVFARRLADGERKAREKQQQLSGVRAMLVEAEANLKLAKEEPRPTIVVPFSTAAWDIHKGCTLLLPKDLQDSLLQLHIAIGKANAVFWTFARQGTNYQNVYEKECPEIAEKGEETRRLLIDWLNGQGEVVLDKEQPQSEETEGATP